MSLFFLEGQQPLPCLAEQEELRKLLPEMVRFEPTWEELELYKDGGVAIIDQWICAHARCLGSRFSQRFLSPHSQQPEQVVVTVCHLCPHLESFVAF